MEAQNPYVELKSVVSLFGVFNSDGDFSFYRELDTLGCARQLREYINVAHEEARASAIISDNSSGMIVTAKRLAMIYSAGFPYEFCGALESEVLFDAACLFGRSIDAMDFAERNSQ
jgi:hypothetical protein